MSNQSVFYFETLRTLKAFKGFLFRVSFLVNVPVAGVFKSFWTRLTSERVCFFRHVESFVTVKLAQMPETFRTLFPFEWFPVFMKKFMQVEATRSRESLGTDLASVKNLSRVRSSVVFQQIQSVKALCTKLTFVWPFPGM